MYINPAMHSPTHDFKHHEQEYRGNKSLNSQPVAGTYAFPDGSKARVYGLGDWFTPCIFNNWNW